MASSFALDQMRIQVNKVRRTPPRPRRVRKEPIGIREVKNGKEEAADRKTYKTGHRRKTNGNAVATRAQFYDSLTGDYLQVEVKRMFIGFLSSILR